MGRGCGSLLGAVGSLRQTGTAEARVGRRARPDRLHRVGRRRPAKRHAILNAVARDLAEDGGQDDTANDDTDTDADTPPPPGSPEAALLAGEVID